MLLILVVLIVITIAFIGLNNITSASVVSYKKCVSAKEAIGLINEKGCKRIYEDEECAKKGLVQLSC